MILKNILIPTITIGQEIYGCNENRVKKLKGIIDSALQMIIKKKNFSRYKAYEKFGIKSIGMMAATARARGVRKWIESSRVIGDLVRNPVKKQSKGTKITWVSGALRWISRTKVNMNLGVNEFRKAIIEYYYKRNKEKEKGEICRISNLCKFNKNNLFKRKKRFNKISNEVMHKILRLKCGAKTWTVELKK